MKTKATIHRYLISGRQYVVVILRNADTGRIISTQTTYAGTQGAKQVGQAIFDAYLIPEKSYALPRHYNCKACNALADVFKGLPSVHDTFGRELL